MSVLPGLFTPESPPIIPREVSADQAPAPTPAAPGPAGTQTMAAMTWAAVSSESSGLRARAQALGQAKASQGQQHSEYALTARLVQAGL